MKLFIVLCLFATFCCTRQNEEICFVFNDVLRHLHKFGEEMLEIDKNKTLTSEKTFYEDEKIESTQTQYAKDDVHKILDKLICTIDATSQDLQKRFKKYKAELDHEFKINKILLEITSFENKKTDESSQTEQLKANVNQILDELNSTIDATSQEIQRRFKEYKAQLAYTLEIYKMQIFIEETFHRFQENESTQTQHVNTYEFLTDMYDFLGKLNSTINDISRDQQEKFQEYKYLLRFKLNRYKYIVQTLKAKFPKDKKFERTSTQLAGKYNFYITMYLFIEELNSTIKYISQDQQERFEKYKAQLSIMLDVYTYEIQTSKKTFPEAVKIESTQTQHSKTDEVSADMNQFAFQDKPCFTNKVATLQERLKEINAILDKYGIPKLQRVLKMKRFFGDEEMKSFVKQHMDNYEFSTDIREFLFNSDIEIARDTYQNYKCIQEQFLLDIRKRKQHILFIAKSEIESTKNFYESKSALYIELVNLVKDTQLKIGKKNLKIKECLKEAVADVMHLRYESINGIHICYHTAFEELYKQLYKQFDETLMDLRDQYNHIFYTCSDWHDIKEPKAACIHRQIINNFHRFTEARKNIYEERRKIVDTINRKQMKCTNDHVYAIKTASLHAIKQIGNCTD